MGDIRKSPGAAYRLSYHLVWCPKYRRAVLTGTIAQRCEDIVREQAALKRWEIGAIEVMPDHVHVLVSAGPKDSPSNIANHFKGRTSHDLRIEFPKLRSQLSTLWSRSFFISTVGAVDEATVKAYIETQYERPWRKKKP